MGNWKFLAIVLVLAPSVAHAQADGQFNNLSAKSTSLPNWTDPLAYGAKCDGITNDTTPLQQAIDATPAGGTVYFPQGNFCLVTSTLTISKAIKLLGSGWSSGLLVGASLGSSADVIHVHSASSPIVGMVMEDFAIATEGGTPGRYGVYLDGATGANSISGFRINHVQIRQLGNAGIATNGPTPPTYDGIFVSNLSDSSIAGGLNLQHAGDSLTITGNVFSGTGSITVNLVGFGSDTAHGFNFFHNNVTCTGGINVVNASGGAISYNNIELYAGATGTNGAVVNLEGNTTTPPENFEVRGNYIGAGPGSVTTGIRVNNMKGTRIEGNTLPRAPGGFVIVTTENADRTEIMMNREQPYGEVISSWLSDAGTNTVLELVDPYTGKLTFDQQVNFYSGISINGYPPLTTTAQTGSGSLVLSNSPTLTTPNLGNATATSLTIGSGVTLGSSDTVAQFFSTPTTGQLVCIKAVGPPIQLGTCSDASGARCKVCN
jgi:Pectate lyase superfamily protein